jgi:hypothetical protein
MVFRMVECTILHFGAHIRSWSIEYPDAFERSYCHLKAYSALNKS